MKRVHISVPVSTASGLQLIAMPLNSHIVGVVMRGDYPRLTIAAQVDPEDPLERRALASKMRRIRVIEIGEVIDDSMFVCVGVLAWGDRVLAIYDGWYAETP